MGKQITRRDFLKAGGQILAGGIFFSAVSMVIPRVAGSADGDIVNSKWQQTWAKQTWGFVVDTEKCIGCGMCVKACKEENGVPMDEEVFRTWVERYVMAAGGQTHIDSPNGGLDFNAITIDNAKKSFFVPKLCNQCDNPPCTKVCPVGATYKTGDGVVLVDGERCIGCRYCIQACPYGARFLHPQKKTADKCTWCYHRITKGLLPACVQVCPTGARIFANLQTPGNPVSRLLETKRVDVLKPALGTEPMVYYMGLDKVVV
ncbi:4Fe-4S dicluster domain-containing protein [Metallumcola ferriviriculae]|uniref:4Fe-4S dicluster domain-containing protein n=1 Tax=Metallumcola ferriviriculae TaxID=3039180 RepID=A0AAU0UPZ5_9FIRM|nr:4Fe-4S dicluster domain-containing protein [Desulfitibacteraceae bacterium MK1]